MKENPYKKPKTHYTVYLDGEDFDTWALNEKAAISNAAYRKAEDEGVDVKLIMWKIREKEIDCEVIEA